MRSLMASNSPAVRAVRSMHARWRYRMKVRRPMSDDPSSLPENPGVEPARVAAFRTGISAEARACAYLILKGYRILAKRYRTPHGEVDVIARRGRALVFVEVKARATLDDAAYAVTPRQQ